MRFLGIIPLVLGIAINLWTDNLFKKNQTTVRPNEKPNKLISEGIFRYSRHPMYLGFVLILLGVAIQLGSITAFVAPLLMFVTLETKFIPLEEKSLQAEFGKEYLRYKAKVGQWFSLPFNKRF
jgi:protein-S-isoprenylcysteine O-methyltransferase Ste14